MATNVELRRSNGTDFNEVIHIATHYKLVAGLLDNNDKIDASLLPDYILGGMSFISLIETSSPTTDSLYGIVMSSVSPYPGAYFIAPHDVTITVSANHSVLMDDDGVLGPVLPGSSVKIEKGDWFIFVEQDGSLIKWAVINNTYSDATRNAKGVIQLATESDATAGVDDTKALTSLTVKSSIAAFATPKSHVGTGGSAHAVATTDSAGFMSTSDKVKLDGIASGANKYTHPNFPNSTVSDISPVKTIKSIIVNDQGHITGIETQNIEDGSHTAKGIIQLANTDEAKQGLNDSKATTPLKVKNMINHFASIPLVTSLTGVDATVAGKLVMLEV